VESGTLSELRHLTRTLIAVETAQPLTGIAALPGVHHVVVDDHHDTVGVPTVRRSSAQRRLRWPRLRGY
jgi:ABC-2 type transport system ATP-binding protein